MRDCFQRLDCRVLSLLSICSFIYAFVGLHYVFENYPNSVAPCYSNSSKIGQRQVKHFVLQDGEYDMLPSGSPTTDAYEVSGFALFVNVFFIFTENANESYIQQMDGNLFQ
jgi:hypothetical protein